VLSVPVDQPACVGSPVRLGNRLYAKEVSRKTGLKVAANRKNKHPDWKSTYSSCFNSNTNSHIGAESTCSYTNTVVTLSVSVCVTVGRYRIFAFVSALSHNCHKALRLPGDLYERDRETRR
jgi:hypothetical protein